MRPVTVIGDTVPVAVIPPGLLVTVYPVIAEPPSEGAVNEICADEFPPTAVTDVGAPGAVRHPDVVRDPSPLTDSFPAESEDLTR